MIGAAASILLLTPLLLAISVRDWQEQRIPDLFNFALGAGGFIASASLAVISPAWSIASAIAGYAGLWAIKRSYRFIRDFEGIGLGDVKLFAAIGAWVGLERLPYVLLVAAAAALLCLPFLKSAQGRFSRLPFGPFLCLGHWMTWVFMACSR